jgi:threonine/homoserine efflux transporter RhtA
MGLIGFAFLFAIIGFVCLINTSRYGEGMDTIGVFFFFGAGILLVIGIVVGLIEGISQGSWRLFGISLFFLIFPFVIYKAIEEQNRNR